MAAAMDKFGILLEKKIEESRIRTVFTPHTPVDSVGLFSGRSSEVRQIIAQINTPGQHSLLFGDRGVGKSSLANITSDLLFYSKIVKGKLYKCGCDSTSTFEHMIARVLVNVGVDLSVEEITHDHTQGGNASIGINAGIEATAGIKSNRKTTTKIKPMRGPISASRAVEACRIH